MVWHLSPRHLAKLFPGRAVLTKPRGPEPILPPNDTQHRTLRYRRVSSAVAALFDKIGPGILVTHSQSGGPGWRTAIKSQNVRAIVAYEPDSNFIFPEGQVPPPIPSYAGPLEALGAPLSEFMMLTKIPIVIYYGDYIPETPTSSPGQDQWRVRLQMARLWRDAVNNRGGDVTLVHLPDIGIHGNTHVPFSDLNNIQIADLMSKWLKKKGLNKYPNGLGRSRRQRLE